MREYLHKVVDFFSIEITFRQFVVFTLLIAFFLIFFLPTNSYDRGYWLDWINTINLRGFENIYSNPSVNYPPLVLYILSVYSGIVKLVTGSNSREVLDFSIHALKIFFITFDVLIIIFTAYVVRQRQNNVAWVGLLLFNIGFWYNTLVFGQTDSMFVGLALLALWFAYTRKFSWSSLFMTLALVSKFQTILWLPVWGLILILGWRKQNPKETFNQILNMLAVFLIAFGVAHLPFIIGGTFGQAVNGAYFASTQARPDELAVNAFNFWHIIMPLNQTKISPRTVTTLGPSYDVIGTVLVILGALITGFIYLIRSVRVGKLIKLSFSKLILLQGILSLVFFFFSTRMHERYVHSAAVALLVYAAVERKLFLGILISLPYFVNLSTVVEFGGSILEGNYLILQPRTVAFLYLAALGVALWNWAGVKVKR